MIMYITSINSFEAIDKFSCQLVAKFARDVSHPYLQIMCDDRLIGSWVA